MDFIFKVMVRQSSTLPSLISWLGGVYLPVSSQNIVDCIGHITFGHKKDNIFFAEGFFYPTNDLDPEKKLLDLHMFDGANVWRKAQKYLRLSILCCHVLLEQIIPAIICLKGGHILKK